MKEEVTLNRKEQNRLVVMNQIEGKKLTVDKAAMLLNLLHVIFGESCRHIERRERQL
jgi:hypothetical protein